MHQEILSNSRESRSWSRRRLSWWIHPLEAQVGPPGLIFFPLQPHLRFFPLKLQMTVQNLFYWTILPTIFVLGSIRLSPGNVAVDAYSVDPLCWQTLLSYCELSSWNTTLRHCFRQKKIWTDCRHSLVSGWQLHIREMFHTEILGSFNHVPHYILCTPEFCFVETCFREARYWGGS